MSGRFATIQSQVYMGASLRFLSAKFSKPSWDLPLSNHKMNHHTPFLHARHALCRSFAAWYKIKVDNGSMIYIYIYMKYTYIHIVHIYIRSSIYIYIYFFYICTYTLVDMYTYGIHFELHPTKAIKPRATMKRLQNQ